MRIAYLTVLAGLLATNPSGASAGQSQWMPPAKLKAYMKSVDRAGQMPVKLECDRRGTNWVQMRVTTQANPSNRRWHWAWGPRVAAVQSRLRGEGLKIVHSDEFTMLLGVRSKCAVWHGPARR